MSDVVRWCEQMALCAVLSATVIAAAQGQETGAYGGGDVTDSAAADDSTSPRDSAAATAAAAAANPLANLRVSGFAEASYSYATHPVGGTIVGRSYDRLSDQFMLDAVKVGVERPYAPGRFDGGFRVDVLVGQDAAVVRSSGFDLGSHGDVTQLYATLNIPTSNGSGVQIKLGKMVTLLGLEVIDAPGNPNWSEGNQFAYVENFTSTGVEVDVHPGRTIDAELRLSNGWDVVQDDNRAKSLMGRIGLAPDSVTSVAAVGYVGAEEPGDDRALRYGGELLVSRKLGGVSLSVQGDYGREQANAALPDSTRAANWWALGAWGSVDVAPKLGLALRADYLDDRRGARTSAAFALPAGGRQHRLTSITATLNVRAWSHVLVRPELRFDHSSLAPFDGRAHQVSAALSIAYVY